MPEKNKNELDYEEIISSEPNVVKTVTNEQLELIKEYRVIINNLRLKKNLTVKEIYELYWDSKTKKHTKTLKTIYRYLEQLEQAGLIKVSGRRKQKGSRTWERLYCVSSIIFYPKDKANETNFWDTEKGQKQMEMIADIFFEYHKLSKNKQDKFKRIYREFDDLRSKIIKDILSGTEDNEQYEAVLSKADLSELKSVISAVATTTTVLQQKELFIKLADLLKD